LKPVVLTAHARTALEERGLELAWIESAARAPEWRTADPQDATLERRFRAIPERDGRVLRTVCAETDTEIRVATVFFDRRAKRPA
jgi:hypothetical protein